MKNTITIREVSGKILGYVDIGEKGNKTVLDFYGGILGYYKASYDTTTDFQGRIVARDDMAAALISMFGNEKFK
jgi:hypothetical protein